MASLEGFKDNCLHEYISTFQLLTLTQYLLFGRTGGMKSKRMYRMRHYILSAAILVAVASSAMAEDGAPYVGVEGGVAFPRSTDYDVSAMRVQTVPTGSGLLGQTVTTTNTLYSNGLATDYKKGLDVDAIAGYDFGFFRLEGELGYKRTRAHSPSVSGILLTDTNTAPISGVTSDSFSFGNRTTVLSGMVDALADYNLTPTVRVYGGGGAGRARVKSLGDRDDVWAYQLIAGASTAIGNNLELGIKYRYFQTDRLHFDGSASFSDSTTGATSVSQFAESGKFRSNSVLVSLIYSFGAGSRGQ